MGREALGSLNCKADRLSGRLCREVAASPASDPQHPHAVLLLHASEHMSQSHAYLWAVPSAQAASASLPPPAPPEACPSSTPPLLGASGLGVTARSGCGKPEVAAAMDVQLKPGLGVALAAGTVGSSPSWLHSADGSGVCLQLVSASIQAVAKPHACSSNLPAAVPPCPKAVVSLAAGSPSPHSSCCQLLPHCT